MSIYAYITHKRDVLRTAVRPQPQQLSLIAMDLMLEAQVAREAWLTEFRVSGLLGGEKVPRELLLP